MAHICAGTDWPTSAPRLPRDWPGAAGALFSAEERLARVTALGGAAAENAGDALCEVLLESQWMRVHWKSAGREPYRSANAMNTHRRLCARRL